MMSNFTFLAVVAAFALVEGFTLVLQHKERKDLYNRIMADNLSDYKLSVEKTKKSYSSAANEVLKRWRDRGDSK